MILLQVQEAVKCRVVERQEDTNGDSGGSFQNGHAQLMVRQCWISVSTLTVQAQKLQYFPLCPQTDFEKDVDMACRSGKLGF